MSMEIGSTINGLDYVRGELDPSLTAQEVVESFKNRHGFRQDDLIVFFTEGHDQLQDLEILRERLFSGILKTVRIARLNPLSEEV